MPTQANLSDEFGVERGTIRKALDLLNQEGLLTGVTKGAPPRVAEQSGLGHPTQRSAATGRLGDALAAAFTAPHVTVEAFTLSGESLDAHMRLCVENIRVGTLPPPRSVTVRILLPVIAESLPLFRAVDDPQETRHRKRLAELARRYTTSIRRTVSDIQYGGLSESVSFEVRQAPITPLQKFYLLNGSEALSGYYPAVRRPIQLDEGGVLEVYDLLGFGTHLFHHTAGSAFVEKARDWFEYHWSSTDTVPFETLD